MRNLLNVKYLVFQKHIDVFDKISLCNFKSVLFYMTKYILNLLFQSRILFGVIRSKHFQNNKFLSLD